MEDHIREDIRENIKEKLEEKYNAEVLKELDGYQNFVYEGMIDKEKYIFRITHISHRNKSEIEGELKFINLMVENRVPAAKPIKISQVDWVEEMNSIDEQYCIVVFEKVRGLEWNVVEHTDMIYFNAGKALGKMHNIWKNSDINIQRYTWNDNQYLQIAGDVIHDGEIIDSLNRFIEELRGLPVTEDSYGLVHGDYLFSNIIYDNNDIRIIDFDECEYNWYVYDIAVYMFYYLLGGDPSTMDIEPNEGLFEKFMTGYLQENKLDTYWIEKMPLFLRLREYILLSSIYRSFYPELGKWQKDYIEAAEYRIKNDIPFIDIDFSRIYKRLLKI